MYTVGDEKSRGQKISVSFNKIQAIHMNFICISSKINAYFIILLFASFNVTIQ